MSPSNGFEGFRNDEADQMRSMINSAASPLPALPDELLAALAREPPPADSTRTSLAYDRPEPHLESTSQSPFSLSYPLSSSASPPQPPTFQPLPPDQPAATGYSSCRTVSATPNSTLGGMTSSKSAIHSPPIPTSSPSRTRTILRSLPFGTISRGKASTPPTVPSPAEEYTIPSPRGYHLPPGLSPAQEEAFEFDRTQAVTAGGQTPGSASAYELRPSRSRTQTGSSSMSNTPSSGSINSRMPPAVVLAAEMSRADSSGSGRAPKSPVDGDAAEEHWRAIVAAGGRRGSALAEEYTRDLSLGRGEIEGVKLVEENDEGEEEDVDGSLRDLQRELAELAVQPTIPTRRPSVFSLRHQLATLSVDPLHYDSAAARPPASAQTAEGGPSSHTGEPGLSENQHTLDPVSPVSAADFIVAVVGPRHVGKSSVIRRGLKRPLADPFVLHEDEQGNRVTTSTTSFSIGGQRRTIEVLEIDEGMLRYSEEGVVWPDGLPQCEAAMLCYDASNANSLDSLSTLLKAFWTRGSDVPLIVLACKSGGPGATQPDAADPRLAANICNVYGAGIVQLDGGLEDPQRKSKECFNWVIRQIMDNRGESMASVPDSPTSSRRDSVQRGTTSFAYATVPDAAIHRPSASGPLALSVVEESPVTAEAQRSAQEQAELEAADAEADAAVAALLAATGAVDDDDAKLSAEPHTEMRGARPRTPLYVSATPAELDGKLQVAEVPPPPIERRGSKTTSMDLFFRREDLIDKFLFAAVAGNDEQFVTLFLITFRRFARPYDVLERLIERFDFVAQQQQTDPLLCRYGQMRLCGILSTWMQTSPGDFAAPTTFGLLQPFLESLLPRGATWVAHYAFELVPLLAPISSIPDPESGWAIPDKTADDSPSLSPVTPRPPLPERRPSHAASYASSSSFAPARPDAGQAASLVPSSTASGSADLVSYDGTPMSRQHTSSDVGTVETQASSAGTGASAEALTRTMPSSAMLVDLSNAILEMREQDIATQITRITWQAFSGMTPRDLMRHVLAPRDPSNPSVAFRVADGSVARSIGFVNHLANWTSTLILVQSRVKARARMIEKLLSVAVELRQQENFDALMGVLAGLNAQPIFRLSETFDLVTSKLDGDARLQPQRAIQPDGDSQRLPKKLRSLNRLMSASKAFAAYRLALANSGITMIPYLGVHLQDLTIVNESKSDRRDGLVNWSKFSQLGKSAAIVLDCAKVAPKLPVDKTIERCVLDVPLLDEDRQYTLSYAHQPRGEGKTGTRSRLRDLAKSTFAAT
ncbi:Ras guanine nucleotide exchange factor R [Rhodotorula toruloides]|nr:Ras guanine nucleotide exchange factor R [Rhodotorula toruloides]